MKYLASIIIVVTIFFGGGHSTMGQNKQRHPSTLRQRVFRVEDRRDHAVEYTRVAELKLASLKTTYRVDETLIVGMAMLNTSSEPIRFYEMSNPEIYLQYEEDDPQRVIPFVLGEKIITPRSFTLLQPGAMIDDTIQLLVGCDDKYYEPFSTRGITSDTRVFEDGRFVYMGHACLKITRPGLYTLIVKQSNQHVVVLPTRLGVKTAVGTITSAPLKISVIGG